ncbi:MAG TPA: hypothetical protein VMZ30_15270 [Pyrinomonadaceae bacterium]|nr:hypothetical protein [Pyrinomonadaceae bacterium]
MSADKYNLSMLFLQIGALLLQSVSLIFLIIYVRKTSQIATATSESLDIAQRMAEAANQSAEATVRSAKAAEDSIRELRETREQETAPYVLAYFDASFDTSLIYLVIKNVGKTPANNVRILFDPPIRNSSRGIEIADLPMIKDGIGSIAPGYEIRTLFDSAISYFGQDNLPLSFKASISYSGGLSADLKTSEQLLDVGAFKGLGDVDHKGLHDLVNQVEQVAKTQSETNKTLQTMVRRIEQGIWLRNQEFIISTTSAEDSLWPRHVLAKLSEFRDIWTSIRDSEEEINLPSSGVQAKCLLLSDQILAGASNRPAGVSTDVAVELRAIAANIASLGRMHFTFGRGSDERFANLAENILRQIDTLEQTLI